MEQSQPGSEEANVMAMINDWREDALDLDALLHTTSNQLKSENPALSSQAPSTTMQDNMPAHNLPAYPQKMTVPTFSSSASRPSVLDLSTTIKFEDRQQGINVNGHQNQPRSVSPHHSPHHSPYMQNNPSQQVFNYSNIPSDPQAHGPVSPHQRVLHPPVSPHNSNLDQAPLSPHMQSPMSPHHVTQQHAQPPMSPHSPYGMPNRNAVSPISVNPHQGMISPGPSSPHHMNHAGTYI